MIYELKQYERYKRQLLNFTTSVGLTLVYSDSDGDGSYSPARNKIKIDPDLDPPEEIAAFLHELGHAIDFMFSKGNDPKYVDKAYLAVYANKHTKNQLKIVMRYERAAWRNAELLAKVLKIKLGKWFFDYKKVCINTYLKS